MVKILKADAVELFGGFGIKSARRWNKEKLAAQLARINTMEEDEGTPEGEDAQATLVLVKEAIENKEEIVVVDGESAEDKAPEVEGEEAPKEKKEKKEEKPKEKKEKTVRKGRLYYSGVAIKKHGLEAGITDEMVAEIDEGCGKANPTESKAIVAMVHQAITGYVNG